MAFEVKLSDGRVGYAVSSDEGKRELVAVLDTAAAAALAEQLEPTALWLIQRKRWNRVISPEGSGIPSESIIDAATLLEAAPFLTEGGGV